MPAIAVEEAVVVVLGRFLKIATVRDEAFASYPVLADPDRIIDEIRQKRLGAHLFTFSQRLPDVTPRYGYPLEWDNVAAVRTDDFERWWSGLPQETRKNVRRAEKRGVLVKTVDFDDALVEGVTAIYNETPVRQGKPFPHYGKTHDTVRSELGTFPDRSTFLGAYKGDELVGFMKIIRLGGTWSMLHILGKNAHIDARPVNALIAESVALCGRSGVSHLIYGSYEYGRKADSSLTEFKRRNGFEKILVPRYYVPLTLGGRLILKLGLHRGLIGLLPPALISAALRARARCLSWFSRRGDVHDGQNARSGPRRSAMRSTESSPAVPASAPGDRRNHDASGHGPSAS